MRVVVVLIAFFLCAVSAAQNIDVSTLRERASLQLTIYNAEDVTLVRETRRVTLRKGASELQFSWANTQIDPSSVLLRFPHATDAAGQVEVVDTRFPLDRNQVLIWSVRSDRDQEVLADISYFTSGVSWSADYVGVLDSSGTSLALDGYVTITNGSGDDYDDASIRLVVGSINLVEAIATLAQSGVSIRTDDMDGDPRGEAPARRQIAGSLLRYYFDESAGEDTNGGMNAPGEPVIVKTALSEYFLFTVPGTQRVKHGWSKRLRLFSTPSAPSSEEYRFRPREYGDQLVRVILVRNDEIAGLGTTPLPDGVARLYRRIESEAGDGRAVLATLSTKYVPIGQEFEFNLGPHPEVRLERSVRTRSRENFWFSVGEPRRLVQWNGGERIDANNAVAGWDDRSERVESVRNDSGRAIKVAWRIAFTGDVTIEESLGATLFDFQTIDFTKQVDHGSRVDAIYITREARGTNEKQSRVQLVPQANRS